MLVTFTSDAYGDITMLGNDATRLIKMMGHSGTIPSALAAKDVPLALSKLKQAIDAQPDAPAEETDDNDEDKEPPVSLVNRAFPLIEMLTAAAEEECSVMWRSN